MLPAFQAAGRLRQSRDFLRIHRIIPPSLFLGAFVSVATANPLSIDLTAAIPVAAAAPYGPGTTTNPQGQELTADQRSFFLNGKPWIPVTGEFHYARYPRADWRDELLKMKAGGINAVSSYVFWIHHEEVQGTFDGSDNRSLHDFIKLCQDLDLKVFLRMGPYCHGEARTEKRCLTSDQGPQRYFHPAHPLRAERS